MNSYKEYYGKDIDGNKGLVGYEHELENSDNAAIKEQIIEMVTDEEYDATVTITLCSDLTGDNVDFDVTISDYLTKAEYIKL